MLTATFLDKVKYVSQDFRARDADFIGNGLVSLSHFPISFPSTPNMSVILGSSSLASVAWCGYALRVSDNAVPNTMTFASANATNPRIDIIQIGVNTTTDANNDTTGSPVLMVKQGVAAASPIEPGADPGFVKLWAVNIAANQTTITAANVIDRRTLVPFNLDGSQITNISGLQVSAFQSFLSDLIGNTSVVYSGGIATKDGSVVTQLDVTAANVYFSTGQHVNFPASTNGQFVTSTTNTTYYLDYNNDGTVSWGTTHSTKSGYVPICSVVTDSSGHILTVTDARPQNPLLPSANLPKASAAAIGAVKIGSNITVAADGTISVPSFPWSGVTGKPTTISGYGITDNLVGSLTAGANIAVTNPTGLGAATVGITGVIPIANGGTGSSTQNFVDTSTAQTIGGAKTFTGAITASGSSGGLFVTGGYNSEVGTGGQLQFLSGYASPISGRVIFGDGTGWQMQFAKRSGTTTTALFTLFDTGKFTTPNNTLDNGSGSMSLPYSQSLTFSGTTGAPGMYFYNNQIYHVAGSSGYYIANNANNTAIFQMDNSGNTTFNGNTYKFGGTQNTGLYLYETGTSGNVKSLRTNGNHFQVVNAGYTSVLFDIDDAGNTTATGSIAAPNFARARVIRMFGENAEITTTSTTATTVLSGVDYGFNYYLHDAALGGGASSSSQMWAYLRAHMYGGSGGTGAYCQLVDTTSNTVAATVSMGGNTLGWATSAAFTLTDGHQYVCKFYSGNGATIGIHSVDILIK